MNDPINDTRLSDAALEAAVDYAYGGAAVRAGRKAQARTFAAMFHAKPAAAKKSEQTSNS